MPRADDVNDWGNWIFSHHGWPAVTETKESKPQIKGTAVWHFVCYGKPFEKKIQWWEKLCTLKGKFLKTIWENIGRWVQKDHNIIP